MHPTFTSCKSSTNCICIAPVRALRRRADSRDEKYSPLPLTVRRWCINQRDVMMSFRDVPLHGSLFVSGTFCEGSGTDCTLEGVPKAMVYISRLRCVRIVQYAAPALGSTLHSVRRSALVHTLLPPIRICEKLLASSQPETLSEPTKKRG